MSDTTTDSDEEDVDGHLADADAEKTNLDLDEIEVDEDGESGDGNPVLGNKITEEEVVRTASDLEAVYDVPVQVSAVLGKTRMEVSQLLKLGRGAVVELDRKVGEAIDIYVNNRLVARGEVVVVDERLGVTMTEIIKTDRS
ncbi:MAG: flagellar motor switch protein FliN [Alphaproteobacteria bacterium]|jgi:flagellar motor switch protein FliN/FliY